MSMIPDELFALVRNGEVDLWMLKMPDPDEMRQRMMDPNFTTETITKIEILIHIEHRSNKEKMPELIQVLHNHGWEIYLALRKSETSVCMLPSQHWQSYREVTDEGESYYCCDICAIDRAEMLQDYTVLPALPAPILDFQAHQKRKRETN